MDVLNGEQFVQRAYEAILQHDFEQAVSWFEQAIAAEPDNAAYHYKLSITYARNNRLEKAFVHARLAAKLDPNNPQYTYHLQNLRAKELVKQAETYFGKSPDQLYMAVELLKSAIMLDPLLVNGFLMLALAYAGLEEYAQAISAIRELLWLDPLHEIGQQLLQQYTVKLHETLHNSN
jgi:tetratricopeptide (TPR) repeat protein